MKYLIFFLLALISLTSASTVININVTSATETEINGDVTPLNMTVPGAGIPSTINIYEIATIPIKFEGIWTTPLTVYVVFLRLGRQCTMFFPRLRATTSTAYGTYVHNFNSPLPERFRPYTAYAAPILTFGGSPVIVSSGVFVYLRNGQFTVRWSNTAGEPWPAGIGGVEPMPMTYITGGP